MHFYPWQSITGTFCQTCSFCTMYISTCLYPSSQDPLISCDYIFLLKFKSQVHAISDPYVVPPEVMISDMLYNNFSQKLLRLPFIDFLYPLTDKISCILSILQIYPTIFSPPPLKLKFLVKKSIKLKENISFLYKSHLALEQNQCIWH